MVSILGHARPVALAVLLGLANTSAFLMPPSPPSPADTRVSSVFSSGIEAGKPGADVTSLLKEPSWPFDKTTFFCPFEAAGVSPLAPRRSTLKPVLLYLPGLDGSGLTPFVQYPDLANVFELRCLTIPATDRSTFTDLISLVRQQLQMCKGRQVFIMGESFGGLLALGTALDALKKSARYTQNIKGVVLVNPATSFSRTLWAKMGTYLTRLPKPLYTLSMLPIGMLLIDAGQIRFTLAELAKQLLSNLQIISNRISQPDLSAFHASFYRAALPVLIQKLDLLPQNTLDWRLLQWLSAGSDMVEPQLHRISYPVLVVAGTVDRLLPSYEEAKRLQAELSSKCSVHYARNMGHGGTLDQRTNLTAILTAWPPCAEVVSPQKLKATRVR